jgi:hypothetical protein
VETGGVGGQCQGPFRGSDDAVRSMTRSLRRRYSAARLWVVKDCRGSQNRDEGYGSGEEIGSVAVRDSPAYRAWSVLRVAAGTAEDLPGILRLYLMERGVL